MALQIPTKAIKKAKVLILGSLIIILLVSSILLLLVSVVVAFFVCWAPFHCQRLLAIYAQGTKSRTLVAIYDIITHASGILYFLSTCINPVLYNIMSNKFRQAFKVSQITLRFMLTGYGETM